MDSTEDEEDTESQIDDLLKALDGIEQCFIPGKLLLTSIKTEFSQIRLYISILTIF